MLELVVFICGLSVMIMELAGMRVITPFPGSSFIVWTSVIGVIMTSLSLGYFLGGKYADRKPSVMKLAFVIFLSALYLFLISISQFEFLQKITSSALFNIYFLSVIVAIVLFTIPSILLAMVSPYALKLAILNRNILSANSGTIIGKFSALATIGSIVGTFACGFFLISFFGIDTIFYFLSCLLLITSFLLCISAYKTFLKSKVFIFFIIIQLIILIFAFFLTCYYKKNPRVIFPDSIFSKTTPYSYICVVQDVKHNLRGLSTGDSFFYSILNSNLPKDDFADKYYHKVFMDVFKLKQKKSDVLVLGNAAGLFVRGMVYNSEKNDFNIKNYDVVEIDKELTQIAYDYFDFPKRDNIHMYYEDARTFLNRESILQNKKYDLIYFDIYSGVNLLVPSHLLSIENFQNINKLMQKEGILLINVVSSLEGKMFKYLKQVYTQVKTVFPFVKIYYIEESKNSNFFNFVIIASKEKMETDVQNRFMKEPYKELVIDNLSDKLYTDLYNPFEYFTF